MDTTGPWVDLLRQAVGVGALELAQRAILHQHLGQGKILLGQFRQHRLGRGRLAFGSLIEDGHAEFFVEDHAQLLG
ncbi:hypothetical protein D3C85_1583020 [compost metagenome]